MAAQPVDLAARLAATALDEPEAARALVEHCHPLVMRIVRAHRPRSVPEEDLAQEVYVKMFTRLDRYEPRADVPFEHWLSRLAVRTCLDVLRAERRRPQATSHSLGSEGLDWLAALHGRRQPPVEDALGARQAVDALLAGLPPADRLVLVWLDLEERSVADVSRLTGWSAGLVRVRAFRARRRLRAAAREIEAR